MKRRSVFPLGQSCGRKPLELKEEVHAVGLFMVKYQSVVVTVSHLILYTFFCPTLAPLLS